MSATAMGVLRVLAPAKVNLGLFVGPSRPHDARHELVSVMQSISLADELSLQQAPAGAREDELVCPALPGPPDENLALAALRAFRRATGWQAGPLRLSVDKRIPVAAGLGGGSADAAAALRLAAHASGVGDERLLGELATELGADVPAQVRPGRWLAGGAGEQLQQLADPTPALGLLVLPLDAQLSTARVYEQADRLAAARAGQELARRRHELQQALAAGAPLPDDPGLLHNDLQQAALALCPAIAQALDQALAAGADLALVSGSGPTVIGLAMGADGPAWAERAAAALAARQPAAIAARSVDAAFARVRASQSAASE